MTLSLSKLQECAESATPGPWTSEDNIVWKDGESIALDCGHLDASFISSFNPETAKALIRVARAALVVESLNSIGVADGLDDLYEALKEIEL